VITNGQEASEKFAEQFKELHSGVDERRYDHGPVFDLFLDSCTDIFGYIPELRPDDKIKEVESFFALVFSMLLLLEDDEHLDRATTRLCKIFSADTTKNHELRLRLLMLLYNTFNLPTFEFRYRIFKHIVDYAAEAGLFDQVSPYLEYLDAWMVDWEKHITTEDKRSLYHDLSAHLRKMNKRLDAFQYLKKYHILYQGESAATIADEKVTGMSVQLLKDAVQLPAVMQFDDILGFDTVKALGKSKKPGAELVDLCEFFLSGSVQSLGEYLKVSKNAKVLTDHGLSQTDAMAKIRLLTLATVAHGRSEMDLKEVAAAIEETEDKVEAWVVRAISEGIIDGRIDQLNHKLLVKSAFQRKFEKDEWGFLDTKLTQWIDNLENVIDFIGKQKTQS